MELPEGWEWLDDMIDDWEVPDELRRPSPVINVSLAIQILSCDTTGLEIRALVGEFILQDALFNSWILEERKGDGAGVRQLAQLSAKVRDQTRFVYEAWRGFASALELEGRPEDVSPVISNARDRLAAALRESVDVLSALRGGGQ
ncbi:hypothetical protein [Streptomyces millisiae]|uniref:Uncharacterized protein n=1 Tax=Streptomyces millisiae TaxID=3075542 RepID=A0ABU2LLW0_9ACTN|nr:hypothetical protein [Streptomyces sp. DSM 44918]MDT0318579.1 hypothetical protein [Streptomyces sp. DSM 44918]